jgi:hypothetical protein
MGYSSLFFVLAFLGQETIGITSALASFPLKSLVVGNDPLNRWWLWLVPWTPWANAASFLNWHSRAKKNWQRFRAGRFFPENCQLRLIRTTPQS